MMNISNQEVVREVSGFMLLTARDKKDKNVPKIFNSTEGVTLFLFYFLVRVNFTEPFFRLNQECHKGYFTLIVLFPVGF